MHQNRKTKKTRMKKNSFCKYTGAGNDFIIIDLRAWKAKPSHSVRKKWAQELCDRNYGIGADGLVFLENSKLKNHVFRWDFYNNDGSYAEMCLNASRCVTLFEYDHKNKKEIFFETDVGTLHGKVLGKNRVSVEIPVRKQNLHTKKISARNKTMSGTLVHAGTPHFLIQKKNFNIKNEKDFAAGTRHFKGFGKHGANVTYWEKKGSVVRAATFERGVEDFTLACGTGAAAVGILFSEKFGKNKTAVKMPGGLLSIETKLGLLKIIGPAKKICEGSFG
jgi:diaminopimelate epimerase